jgi:hypothetical protein
MKKQKAFVTFVLCLISSFAAADTPTDAPLLPDNANSIVAQSDKNAVKHSSGQNKLGKCVAQNVAQMPKRPSAHADSRLAPPQANATPSL